MGQPFSDRLRRVHDSSPCDDITRCRASRRGDRPALGGTITPPTKHRSFPRANDRARPGAANPNGKKRTGRALEGRGHAPSKERGRAYLEQRPEPTLPSGEKVRDLFFSVVE